MNKVIPIMHGVNIRIVNTCEQIQKASLENAAIRAMIDVRDGKVDLDAYKRKGLEKERAIYIKKVNELNGV